MDKREELTCLEIQLKICRLIEKCLVDAGINVGKIQKENDEK